MLSEGILGVCVCEHECICGRSCLSHPVVGVIEVPRCMRRVGFSLNAPQSSAA